MQFLILDLPLDSKLFSCFLFLFLDMRSLHQPISWRSRAKWTLLPRHRVCSPCWFKEPRQEPCWIEVPCFMRGDVRKWCHSSKSFSFLFFSLFQNLLEKKLRSKPRSPTSTPNQQHRPQGRMHLWSWIMKHV